MLLLHILYPKGRRKVGSYSVVNAQVHTKYVPYSAQVLLIYLQRQTELCSKVAHGLNILLILCMPVPLFLPGVHVLHLPWLISAYQDRQLQDVKDGVSLSARTEMCGSLRQVIFQDNTISYKGETAKVRAENGALIAIVDIKEDVVFFSVALVIVYISC